MNRWRLGYRPFLFAALLLGVLTILAAQVLWASSFEAPTAVSDVPMVEEPAAVATAVLTGSQPLPTTVTVVSLADLPLISDDSLAPLPNPRTYQAKLPAHTFETHTVARGETPNIIADQYGISAETLLGGNPWLSQESNQLQAGEELVILPIDGVLHTVQPGETLASIAELYSVPVADIVGYASNNIEAPYFRLVPESQILIPGASVGQFYWTAPKTVAGSGGSNSWSIVGTNTYVWPINGRCITQYYWYGHPGLDVSMSEGSAVYASDQGTVTYASWAAGTYYDYGNLIVINHGNGYETLYAHLSSIAVYPGQIVYQGDFIGSTGNTGRSSGPHIHFEIRQNDFRDDPLFYLSGSGQNCT